ncbi:MAG TPA: glycogen/starch/alpha-glucan phosphorylase [Syntrophorhabdaceae bacterium]|jgi:starch phosphorylase
MRNIKKDNGGSNKIRSSSPLSRMRRTGTDPEVLKLDFLEHLNYTMGRTLELATLHDYYMAFAYTVRDRLLGRWLHSIKHHMNNKSRFVGYFSAEFLVGPHLENNLINLGMYDCARKALAGLHIDLKALIEAEKEPGLGSGGLGRLSACYLDSLSTLNIHAIGYGIRYEFGIFDQEIRDGGQSEKTDKWLSRGNPWEIIQPELSQEVGLGGYTEILTDEKGEYKVKWVPAKMIKGVPYDTPITGYGSLLCNTLRLWKSEAIESFDFQDFNVGNYYEAVEEKVTWETITKVLYPNDEPVTGKKLRFVQQYFFVSCSLKDMLRVFGIFGVSPQEFHDRLSIQLNDTHPSIAVAELMRLLVDEYEVDWDRAWDVTRRTFAYTNHTLLPEALETWPVSMFEEILPRHLEIIYEVNRRFLGLVRLRFPGEEDRVRRMSLINESGERFVRMAHLASVGSHAINGVAELHSELLRRDLLRDFAEYDPALFTNVTNGVTPRRFLLLSNPRLSRLITSAIGDGWITDLQELRKLEQHVNDKAFLHKWRAAKRANKKDLAALVKERCNVTIDPSSLFDIQVKRIHEYKRQHLNILHILTLYNRILADPDEEITPRTFIFGGKAAPGYYMAKLIIKLIHSVADAVHGNPVVADRLKVVFFPNFNVKNGQKICPAADLSEQISLAGKEASGTGNMKFTMNGALTIGTLDGANVEIREEVGSENFFLFGLTTPEVAEVRSRGYIPHSYYEADGELRAAIDLISSGFLSGGDPAPFQALVQSLLGSDPYMVLADYRSYIDTQDKVGKAFRHGNRWARTSILNTARAGKFSSDRAIKEYGERIWNVSPAAAGRLNAPPHPAEGPVLIGHRKDIKNL